MGKQLDYWDIISYIGKHGPVTCRQIANHFGVPSGSIYSFIAPRVTSGLIVKVIKSYPITYALPKGNLVNNHWTQENKKDNTVVVYGSAIPKKNMEEILRKDLLEMKNSYAVMRGAKADNYNRDEISDFFRIKRSKSRNEGKKFY